MSTQQNQKACPSTRQRFVNFLSIFDYDLLQEENFLGGKPCSFWTVFHTGTQNEEDDPFTTFSVANLDMLENKLDPDWRRIMIQEETGFELEEISTPEKPPLSITVEMSRQRPPMYPIEWQNILFITFDNAARHPDTPVTVARWTRNEDLGKKWYISRLAEEEVPKNTKFRDHKKIPEEGCVRIFGKVKRAVGRAFRESATCGQSTTFEAMKKTEPIARCNTTRATRESATVRVRGEMGSLARSKTGRFSWGQRKVEK
ncbi:hypothetical protein GLAREA_05681 [Glarea lozoyensis ATCC 20868]|uniref:Uncharacterized protein n=1 Tax=Glarea lozoyensis (strain ATCC 20868 / MF5171) TaxID=1116229 RepID=S3EDI9_GLAL2|nr:uncharacterized protein GLAREA_05681 [Glarea lozoyensis ATCC 20868]EPE36343.1 hypothetical protein GLAREA_05681 [Glarea lozoyensis ATCC 20868]